jgi:hypothetical protein
MIINRPLGTSRGADGIRNLSPTTKFEMTIAAIADALWRRAPSIYRAARPPWRLVMRLLGRPTYASYWERRRDFNYYAEAVRLARAHAPNGRSVLDVGANETEVTNLLHWFDRRVVLDRSYVAPRPGVETVTIDFMRYQPPVSFDLVLCLQVLEHVADPASFAKKLLATGRTVILSVPHAWPAGLVPDHVHDPIDEHTLGSWTGREPAEVSIVEDLGKKRLLAVYTASAMPG